MRLNHIKGVESTGNIFMEASSYPHNPIAFMNKISYND